MAERTIEATSIPSDVQQGDSSTLEESTVLCLTSLEGGDH